MSAPRHLWSENWREESDAAAAELARRRAQAAQPDLGLDESAQPAAAAPNLGRRRRVRMAALAVLVALLTAGTAYAAISLLAGSGDASSALALQPTAWLGVQVTGSSSAGAGFPTVGNFQGGFPSSGGVLVTAVVPGSPAAAAGVQPGDVLTQIGDQPVASSADVASALAGLRAGEQVELQYEQGALLYQTQVTLVARPADQHP